MTADGEPGAEIYAAATKRDQAKTHLGRGGADGGGLAGA